MTAKVKYRDLFPRKNYKVFVYTEEEFKAAVLAEREACAKVCDDYDMDHIVGQQLAAAIRERGEK